MVMDEDRTRRWADCMHSLDEWSDEAGERERELQSRSMSDRGESVSDK